jgi:hypothetical protein
VQGKKGKLGRGETINSKNKIEHLIVGLRLNVQLKFTQFRI